MVKRRSSGILRKDETCQLSMFVTVSRYHDTALTLVLDRKQGEMKERDLQVIASVVSHKLLQPIKRDVAQL